MKFFHKSPTPPVSESSTATPSVAPEQLSHPLTAEEAVREAWLQRHGEPMPDEIMAWLKQQTRDEARRRTIAASLLSPQREARIRDAQRLAETKLQNIESSLRRVHDQQEWLQHFKELNRELEEHRRRLYELNKQLAVVADDERELSRFEAFETIQGNFLRMQFLEQLSRDNKQQQSLIARQTDDLRHRLSDEKKMVIQAADDVQDATKQLLFVHDQLEQVYRLLGARGIIDLDHQSSAQLLETIASQLEVLSGETAEQQELSERLQQRISQLSIQRQAMEPHQQMLEHGEVVLARLERLHEMHQQLSDLQEQLTDLQRRQQEENDMLGHLFAEYQGVESDIESLTSELLLHRNQNLGRSSYALQERAQQLKSRRQMLLSAQSLWNRIQSGYRLIEEKSQRVNRLRLSIDNLQRNIAQLEECLVPMRQLCHEKEYTLTLSKSQNVIHLRGDLREGVSCTVCGATHHPYHSDTMLEQSKLISDLRTDFELMQTELVAREAELADFRLQLAAEQGRHEVEEEALSQLRQRQMQDVKEWALFSSLDRSFQECSSGTNLEARTAMLRQLLENSVHDADDAQRELDEYNFHQTRINEISEILASKDRHKGDLTLRLNEVNTGCQVMAGSTERLQKSHALLQQQFTQLYEQLNATISLGDWYPTWQAGHEGLRLRIEQMMSTWQNLCTDIAEAKDQLQQAKLICEQQRQAATFLQSVERIVTDNDLRLNTLRRQGEDDCQHILAQREPKDFFEHYHHQLLQARTHHQTLLQQAEHDNLQLSDMQGRDAQLQQQGSDMAQMAADERSRLDVWMRQFNANHPPVQYAELQQAFSTERDWNATRQQVRALRIEVTLEQNTVDRLRSRIVALQAEGKRPSGADDDNIVEVLTHQQQQLEQQRHEVLLQMAEHHAALKAHAEGQQRLKAEEEERYERSDRGEE